MKFWKQTIEISDEAFMLLIDLPGLEKGKIPSKVITGFHNFETGHAVSFCENTRKLLQKKSEMSVLTLSLRNACYVSRGIHDLENCQGVDSYC